MEADILVCVLAFLLRATCVQELMSVCALKSIGDRMGADSVRAIFLEAQGLEKLRKA